MAKPLPPPDLVPKLMHIGAEPYARACDAWSVWADHEHPNFVPSKRCRRCDEIDPERFRGPGAIRFYPGASRPWLDVLDPDRVLSKQVVDALIAAGIRGIEAFPLKVEVSRSDVMTPTGSAERQADPWGRPPDYCWVNTQVRGIIDRKASGFRRVQTCERCGAIQSAPNFPPNGFRFVECSIEGADLFRTSWNSYCVFCTPRVYELARKHQWTGLRFYDACTGGEEGYWTEVPHLDPAHDAAQPVVAEGEREAPTNRLRTKTPTKTELSKALGVRAPGAFVTLIRIALKDAKGSKGRFDRFLEETFGIASLSSEIAGLLEDPPSPCLSSRWPQAPPEVFPFAAMGTDGVYYGLVVHAPELDLPDMPVAQVDPMEEDCPVVSYLGRDMTEALDALMSYELYGGDDDDEGWESDGDTEMDRRERLLAEALELKPTLKKARGMFSLTPRNIPLLSSPPSGWKYVRTSDDVGVLAESRFFRPRPRAAAAQDEPELLRLVEADLREGYPASALVQLREWCWGVPPRGYPKELAPYLTRAYEALGRPVLALVCARMSEASGA